MKTIIITIKTDLFTVFFFFVCSGFVCMLILLLQLHCKRRRFNTITHFQLEIIIAIAQNKKKLYMLHATGHANRHRHIKYKVPAVFSTFLSVNRCICESSTQCSTLSKSCLLIEKDNFNK